MAATVVAVAVAVAAAAAVVVIVVVGAPVAVAAVVLATAGTGRVASSGFGTSWMLNSWPSCSRHREKEAVGGGDELLRYLPATTKSVTVLGCWWRQGRGEADGR